ncbi:MAG: PIG-L family deacetylase [Luteitalea sp.]|nr:PIG-L family deacetylase [Luteitalea sp.]
MTDQRLRVLVVMAHPDDAEILVGGTLLRLVAEGWAPGIITMTAGDCGSSEARTKEDISRIRYTEAVAAADSIGAWYACAGLADVEVFANAQSVRAVVELLRTFRPDVVITHSPADYMLDHEETSRIVRAAVFAAAVPLYQTRHAPPAKPVPSTPVLYYADAVEGMDSMGRRIHPNFYIDISDQMERKRTLVGHHASQRAWLRDHHGIDEYLSRMTEWAEAYGGECGVAHAEGLRQHRGHGYPHEARLQEALKPYVRIQGGEEYD